MEITALPLKRVFAIIDLFQGVLEPSELFLEEEREMFQHAGGLRLKIPLPAPTIGPNHKAQGCLRQRLQGMLPNIHNSYKETNTFLNIPSR